MDKQGNKNLNELLAAFMDEQTARQMAEDIETGDKLFNDYPAPEPGEAAVAAIKARVATTLNQRRRIGVRRRVWAIAGLAAAIVVISSLVLRLFEKQPVSNEPASYATVIPARVWDGDDITADDTDIAILAAEIEAVENQLLARDLEENGGTTGAEDLEIELLEVGGDFWKG